MDHDIFGAGEIIGDSFGETAELVEILTEHRDFASVCFDTQHAFASGYDLRSKQTIIGDLSRI